MKHCQARSLIKSVIIVFTLSLTDSVFLLSDTRAQAGASIDPVSNFRALPRASHPACPNCFTIVGQDRYEIFEEFPGTGMIVMREIPNPAPFDPGEQRLEVDPETGLPIWYIGHQPYVGPTDEQPFSPEFPVPKIALQRIQARHHGELLSIPGVHAFGIGAKGFVVFMDPQQVANASLVPQAIEKVPLEVVPAGRFEAIFHQATSYRPVPTSAVVGAFRPEGGVTGTTGPHIVLNNPLRIWTLTTTHVVKQHTESPSAVQGRTVYQPGPGTAIWGVVGLSFQQTPCTQPPNCLSGPVNSPSVNPDVAAIAHTSLAHSEPCAQPPALCGHTSPSGSSEPIRRMYYGPTSSVNGPSGIVQTAGMGTSLKWWGAYSDAPKGSVTATGVFASIQDPLTGQYFAYSPVDVVKLERGAIQGDSGCLVAGNGVTNRHVMGLGFARSGGDFSLGIYFRSSDVQAAIQSATGGQFRHFWGTASGRPDLWYPANTQCDGSC
jgi:hypothetical protein